MDNIKILEIIISCILGASLASFVNAVAYRTIKEEKWGGNERSKCPSCGHILTAFELIPLFSYIGLFGKCKNCRTHIPISYFLAEVAGAILAGIIACKFTSLSPQYFFMLIFAFMLLLNALTDIKEGYIYDAFALSIIIPGMIWQYYNNGTDGLLTGLYGLLGGFLCIATIIIVSRGGMGWGDAFLMAGIGSFIGYPYVFLSIYIAVMLGGLIGIFLLIIGKVKWGKKQTMVFGPYLALGAFITIIWGEIISYMLNIPMFIELVKLRFQGT